MSRFWSSIVQQLTPYVPGEQPKLANLIKLNTNENPYPPSPKAVEAMRQELGELGEKMRLYPDPNGDLVKQAVVELFPHAPLSKQHVFVGNGSDEVLAFVFQGLLHHAHPVLFPDITYSFYPVYCGLYQVPYKLVPLTHDFSMGLEDYRQANGGIIFPNPNAPTGKALSLADIETLLRSNPDSVVAVDEAYIDFGGESAIPLVTQHDNLLVIRTLSKSHSLAGLRVGYAVGHPALIEALERVKNSFNSYPLDRLALVGAAAALGDVPYVQETCRRVVRTRETLVGQLQELGFEVIPSTANFIFTRHPQRDAATLAAELRARSIIVRHFKLPRIDQHLRISIGTDTECQALVTALQEIFGGNRH